MESSSIQNSNVILLFSKLPEVGLVKTRLTTLKDGIFAPDVASALYHCMLFDVTEICMAAIKQMREDDPGESYSLVISTAPESNLDKMESLFSDAGTWPEPIVFISDSGKSFDEHYNDAFAQVWEMGAKSIVSMGADMPALTVWDITRAFDALRTLRQEKKKGIILAPDQEMGVSVIGWNADTNFDHSGVFYNETGLTVLPAYIRKAKNMGLAAMYLPPIPDVDTMADLHHNITLVEALNYCAPFDGNTPPWRTAQALAEMGYDDIRVAPNGLLDPRGKIDL